MKRLLLLLPFCLLLFGCASEQEKIDLTTVQQSNVSLLVYTKMQKEIRLDIADIIELSRHHVDDSIIIRAVRRSGAVYYLDTKQVERLRKAGVGEDVVNYLLSTPQLYNYYYGPYNYGPGYYDPYYNDPFYGGGFYGAGTIIIDGGHHHHHHH